MAAKEEAAAAVVALAKDRAARLLAVAHRHHTPPHRMLEVEHAMAQELQRHMVADTQVEQQYHIQPERGAQREALHLSCCQSVH